MPLDSGAVTQFSPEVAGASWVEAPAETSLASGQTATIGAVLRATREFRGLTLQDLADVTRIRRAYLAALEEMRLDQLPSRPFTIGYVRAYAQALRLDPDDAVARFKADAPPAADVLRAPVGVSRERDPRLSLAGAGAAVVVSAVLIWNLAQHAVADVGPATPAVPEAATRAAPVASGAVVLSAAQPAPIESGMPTPYVTPGLQSADGVTTATAPDAAAAALAPAPMADASPALGPSFIPKGAIYGVAPQQSNVTLQALKTASLIVRGVDGSVYFARQLSAGEAYRAPSLKGLTVDVSDPGAFNVYADGELRGPLPAAQTPLSRLTG